MNASDLTPGTTIVIRRITRTGARRSWTGRLLAVGTMANSTGPMDYVVILSDYGREIFAIDPSFSTTLEETCPCIEAEFVGHDC